MSLDDSGNRYIDKKNQDYFGHSNAKCPLDLKKSVFLEPTEKDTQLIPYTQSCEFDWNVRKYNHIGLFGAMKGIRLKATWMI